VVPDVLYVNGHAGLVLGISVMIEDVNQVAGGQYALRYAPRREGRSRQQRALSHTMPGPFPAAVAERPGESAGGRGGGSSFGTEEITVTTTVSTRAPGPPMPGASARQ
jgi:hypothetical protein